MNGFGQGKTYHLYNEKSDRRNSRKNTTAEFRKNTNARRKGNYKNLGILKAKMDEKIRLRRTGKLLENNHSGRNLFKDVNIWVVLLVRYSGSLSKLNREEHRE